RTAPPFRPAPNPIRDTLLIQAEQPLRHVYIYHQSGSLLWTFTEKVIPTANWPAGIFWVGVEFEDGKIHYGKVVKAE
ncbi:MAG: hypothetical protein KDC44_23985, partial [Phaeodactylibacter sp.]|nr:hypothetical protein [Phaeodactylibacter sp.]